MIAYAIRHKVTGLFMPFGSGSTWWEPLANYTIQPPIPRLFETKRGAISSIEQWYRGRAKPALSTEGGWEEPIYEVVSGVEYEAPEMLRTKGDLEVVEFRLEENCAPQT